MGLLHEAATWCEICPAGWKATHWDIYNKKVKSHAWLVEIALFLKAVALFCHPA